MGHEVLAHLAARIGEPVGEFRSLGQQQQAGVVVGEAREDDEVGLDGARNSSELCATCHDLDSWTPYVGGTCTAGMAASFAALLAHQATGHDEFAKWVDRRDPKAGRQRDKLLATADEYRFVCHDERTDPFLHRDYKYTLELLCREGTQYHRDCGW